MKFLIFNYKSDIFGFIYLIMTKWKVPDNMADASGDQGGAIEGQMGMEEVGGEKRPRNGQTAGSATRAKRGRPFQSQTKKMESARKKKEEKEYVSSHRAVLLNGLSLEDCGR